MKKQIVFLEPFPEIMIYKIARMFKDKGYETVSIRLLENKDSSFKFYDECYDKIIKFNLIFFKFRFKNLPSILSSNIKKIINIIVAGYEISSLRPYVVISRAIPSWPCALTRRLFKNIPLIYFPYDIRSEVYPKKVLKNEGIKKFEINSEKYCFENTDGIIHKGDPNELKHLEGRIFDKINFTDLKLNFLPYCSNDFVVPFNKNKLSKGSNEFHIVQVSSIGSVDPSVASFLFDYLIKLTKEKIHVHQYIRPNTLTKEESMRSIEKVYGKKIDLKYFHLHEPLNPKELIREISKYDFGIIIPGPCPIEGKFNLQAEMGTTNKLASYLEAGIPYIYPPELKFVDKISKKYGINFCTEDVKEISKLRDINYKKIENKIYKARKDFDMDKNFIRLEKFIHLVVKNKKLKKITQPII